MLGHLYRSMELHQVFGRNVKEARKRAGLTQDEFAHLSGLARSYMSDVERGAKNPTLEVVGRIAKALQLPPGELLSGDYELSERYRASERA